MADDRGKGLMNSMDKSRVGRLLGRWAGWAALSVLAAVVGCGDNATKKFTVFPVKGKVLLPDGSPLTSGRVVFVSKSSGEIVTGPIASDGTFSLTSGASGDGAPPGEYLVRIEPDETKLKAVPKGAPPGAALPFPGKYTDEGTSGLTATVKAEPNDLPPFKMDKVAPPKTGPAAASSKVRD
jgi:hypothetical protein